MYSAKNYVEMLIVYRECGRNAREPAKIYAQRFPNRNHPVHKTILSVQIPMTVRTVENEEDILDAF
jgi:hypothetical protein